MALRPEWHRSPDVGLSKINDLKRLFFRTARNICPDWQVAGEHRYAINDIFRWCLELDGNLDCNKGLWLWGNNGTGKTTMLKIIKDFCRKIGKRDAKGNIYSFRIVNVPEVCGIYEDKGRKGLSEFVTLPCQAFDELGAEETLTGHFGNPINVMQYILMGRYDRRYENFTHVTTNLEQSDLLKRYGPRVYDRCKEMFNFVYLGGKTYRKKPYGMIDLSKTNNI